MTGQLFRLSHRRLTSSLGHITEATPLRLTRSTNQQTPCGFLIFRPSLLRFSLPPSPTQPSIRLLPDEGRSTPYLKVPYSSFHHSSRPRHCLHMLAGPSPKKKAIHPSARTVRHHSINLGAIWLTFDPALNTAQPRKQADSQ